LLKKNSEGNHKFYKLKSNNTNMDKQITVYAVGHWSTQGNLEAELFEWGLDVNGKYVDETYGDHVLKNRDGAGRQFYQEIRPYLPDNHKRMVCPPSGIPGGTWAVDFPLKSFKEPEKVLTILKKYFPKTFQEK
jgi:hypothetical protein